MSLPPDFTPVPRKCRRRDGWTAERQQGFIAALRQLGDPEKAAQTQGLTGNGAYQLRKAAGAESFAAAWDAAVDQAGRRRGGRPTGADPPEANDDDGARASAVLLDQLIAKYGLKLGQERRARLEGRIVEADFYCRQLSCLEVMLCLADGGLELLQSLRAGHYGVLDIAATALSNHLEQVRRSIWREKGEADRPPPTMVARLEGARGEIGIAHDDAIRGGSEKHMQSQIAAKEARARIMAEVQAEWEERARTDAAAWAAREAKIGGGDGPAPDA